MLEALYQIGKVQSIDILNELVLSIDEKYRYILKIQFEEKEDNFHYLGVDFEENDFQKKNRYLRLDTKGSGAAKTPCATVTEISKTFRKKLLKSIQKFISDYKPEDNHKAWLLKLNKVLQENRDKIEQDLLDMMSENEDLKKQNKALLISVIQNGKEKYPGDWFAIIDTLKSRGKNIYKSYYEKNKIKSIGRGVRYCYFCNQKKEEVWGYASPFAFYTVDKISFVPGGFKPELAWKNYPVCPDCALTLHAGASYVKKHLKFSFTRYNYFLLPLLLQFDENNMKTLLSRAKQYENFWLNEKATAKIDRIEFDLLRRLAKWENMVHLNFMFYEETNSAFNIILLLQEIPPSRLKKIVQAQDEINEKYSFLSTILEQTDKDFFEANFFSMLKYFFMGGKEDLDFKRDYFSILRNIFYLKPVEFLLLLDRFMAKIRKDFVNGKDLSAQINTLKALKLILFFKKLKLLHRRDRNMQHTEGPYDNFFKQFPIFYDSTQKALFLEGVLAGQLLSIQYADRKSKPFYDRLNGLKIDEKIAKRLLPEIINKLEEYDKNYAYLKDIEQAISYYFMFSKFNNYSIDELSFYFTLGLAQSPKFNQFIKKTEEKEDVHE